MKLSVRTVGMIAGATIFVSLVNSSLLLVAKPAAAQTDLRSDRIQQSGPFQEAYRMSDAFRTVSKQAMPAVVAIKTEGKTVERTVSGSGFPRDQILRDFFGDDPRFEQFFPQESTPQRRQYKLPGGQGSGFIIDPNGVVLTNAHVVDESEKVIVMLSDGREFEATSVKLDRRADVAVLKIDTGEQLPYLPLGNDDNSEIGDWVLAFGSPFGMHRTVTQGIISAKGRGLSGDGNKEFLQTDAAVNPGNSGGPLVNLRGEVVGMNTAISTRSGGYDGVSLAVPVNMVRWASDQLLQNGRVQRAYVGIQMQEINAELAKSFNLNIPRGVVVTGVMPDSPADLAGFQQGDVIQVVNGQEVRGQLNMLNTVERLSVGKTYPIEILRAGKPMTLKITVIERPETFASSEDGDVESYPSSSTSEAVAIPELELQAQSLTPEIARDLQMPNSKGLVISSVEKGGVAYEAGLRPGMVISSIANQPVTSITDAKAAIQAFSGKSRILLLVQISDQNRIISRFVSVPIAR